MANRGGRRSAEPDNSSLILGILIGMVLGLVVAGGVAWHISKRPSTFNNKDDQASSAKDTPAPDTTPVKPQKSATPTKPAQDTASSTDGKQRFEFYKILTEKDSTATSTSAHNPPPAAPSKVGGTVAYLLQAGSFANSGDAENLKAKLALLGLEASVQVADVQGFGTRYRVRLGPYRTTEDLNRAKATLKQNGITDPAQLRAQ
jgi:cell division protein FtsN